MRRIKRKRRRRRENNGEAFRPAFGIGRICRGTERTHVACGLVGHGGKGWEVQLHHGLLVGNHIAARPVGLLVVEPEHEVQRLADRCELVCEASWHRGCTVVGNGHACAEQSARAGATPPHMKCFVIAMTFCWIPSTSGDARLPPRTGSCKRNRRVSECMSE